MFKFKKKDKPEKKLSATQNNNDTDPLYDSVSDYLNRASTGALMITGDWGSGKTFHIKNTLFKLLENDTVFTPIIVSMYGESDKAKIASKILLAYLDKKGKDVKLSTGSVLKGLTNISEGLPIIKKYIDVNKLFSGTGDGAFNFLPHDQLLICFDDIERLADSFKIDSFLGIVNDLVENRGCKVLLIANEQEIPGEFKYKEKTIDKIIHYSPDLKLILQTLIESYSNEKYKSFLKSELVYLVKSVTAPSAKEIWNSELKRSFSNIRTLKFALEHFFIVFKLLVDDGIDQELPNELKNLWLFTLSVSIEFRKHNGISFSDRKNLDVQSNLVTEFDAERNGPTKNEEIITEETEIEYSKNFKSKYYDRLSVSYIFFSEIYELITAGKKIDKEKFRENVRNQFNIENGIVHPGHKILDTIQNFGYWSYTNEKFRDDLISLLRYVNNGELNDIVSYLNASVFLLNFSEIINCPKDDILKKIFNGLNIFLPRTLSDNLNRSQFEMVEDEFKDSEVQKVVDYIKNQLQKLDEEAIKEKTKLLEEKFTDDIIGFSKELFPDNSFIRSPVIPILKNFNVQSPEQFIKRWQPEEITHLINMLKFRYQSSALSSKLNEERPFLDSLKNAISKIEPSSKTLSSYLIEKELLPAINESINNLNHFNE